MELETWFDTNVSDGFETEPKVEIGVHIYLDPVFQFMIHLGTGVEKELDAGFHLKHEMENSVGIKPNTDYNSICQELGLGGFVLVMSVRFGCEGVRRVP